MDVFALPEKSNMAVTESDPDAKCAVVFRLRIMTSNNSIAVFLLSLLAIPLTYVVNSLSTPHEEVMLLVVGIGLFVLFSILVYFAVRQVGESVDPLYYVLMLGTFSSVGALIIGLENDGLLKGFMTRYLESGEPYLTTAHGTIICYWDGLGHYAMYLYILWALAKKKDYRNVALYWTGSIGHSMLVFIPGNLTGKHGMCPSFLLNVPYMIFPYWCAARFLRERPWQTLTKSQAEKSRQSLWRRPLDLFFILGLISSSAVACLRALAILDCRNNVIHHYLFIEPYLTDPVSYPKIQMLVYFFYFIPYYVMAIIGLIYSGHSWMPDWSLIHAGAAIQAQLPHIWSSFHQRTEQAYHVPVDPEIRTIFWTINIGLLLLPQLLAVRCTYNQDFFTGVGSSVRGQKTLTGGLRSKMIKKD